MAYCSGCHQELSGGPHAANGGCVAADHERGHVVFDIDQCPTCIRVWVRVGDQDDYHDFTLILDAGEHVAEHVGDAATQILRYQGPALTGVELCGTPYIGCNGVSLYWGDPDAQKTRDLTDEELDEFRHSYRSYDFE